MKQFKKYCIGMLLLMTLVMVTACGRANNGAATDNNGAAGENEDDHIIASISAEMLYPGLWPGRDL